MTPPEPPQPDPSLEDLEAFSDAQIEEAAEKVEDTGKGGVNPVDPRRNMRFYKVSENELGSLSALNDATVGVFSLVAALATFAIDVTKDVFLAETIPEFALRILWFGAPMFLIVIVILFFIAFKLRKAKRSVVQIIRDESSEGDEAAEKGLWFKLQWPIRFRG